MQPRTPISTRTHTFFPYTTLFRYAPTKTRWLGALPLGSCSGVMRTDFACTERVVICPRNSPETFLNVPILAMSHSFLGSGRTIAASMRIGRQRGPAVQPQARSAAEDRAGTSFLFREERRHAGGRKSKRRSCTKPGQRSGAVTDGAWREAAKIGEEHG